jgi:hypothetical protein
MTCSRENPAEASFCDMCGSRLHMWNRYASAVATQTPQVERRSPRRQENTGSNPDCACS